MPAASWSVTMLTTRRIAIAVGIGYYVASLIIFRQVLFAIPAVLRGDSVIVGDELVPFFNPTSQLFDQAKGEFNQLTHGYEFRVRYSFLTTWLRYYKVLPFAILFIIPTVFWAVYLTTARFIDRVFTTLSSQSIYLATAFPTALIYMIMTYAKITHFYTLIVGLAMMTISSLWMLYGILFAERKWKRYMVLSSVVSLLNPAIHYLILFMLFFALTIFTLGLGELARWLRRGGLPRARRLPRTIWRLVRRRGRRRKLGYLRRRTLDSTLGRCTISGVIFVVVTLIPYALFVKFIALRGVPNLSETVPGDYYFIRDASVSWLHILSWDLAGITDKILFGDYLAKVPRFPNIAYSFLLLIPLVVRPVRRRLFVTRPHRQLLGVIYVSIGFSVWATIGYAEPIWFPTFHRAVAGLTRTAHATDTPIGDLTLAITSTIVQVLRFPHRFQLILFMLAPFVMSLSLAFGIDTVSGRWSAAAKPGKIWQQRSADDVGEVTPRATVAIRLLATALVASTFFVPFWSNAPYHQVFSSGDFGTFLAPYPTADLAELKQALLEYPEGKTVVLPPTETAKLVTDSNGVDHKFIDKFFIYYLDQPSYYYGLTGDTINKFEFFLMLRGIYYQQDWWVNVARDIDVKYIIVNKLLRDNRGVGAEYLPNVENYVEPGLERRDEDFALRFENDTYALYELTDSPNPERETLLIDSSWSSFLDLVFTRLDLSRCYDFEYLPYYDPPAADERERINLVTDDPQAAAMDLYLLDHPEYIAKPDSKIFAFNPDIVASSYYLSPMFRSFLFFSNTKWNRTEVITPGVFGSLRGSFIGVPRPTRFDIPVIVTTGGRYRVVMRAAATANDVTVRAASLGFEETFEMRSPAENLEMFDVDEVYLQDRQPVDTAAMSVQELEQRIGDDLVPVNLSFAYQDIGVLDIPAGIHKFAVDKTDGNPMLVEGLMLIPEAADAQMALGPEVSVVTDANELDCSERTPVAGPDVLYVDPAANAAHPDLNQDELLTLAAAGVEDLVPDNSGGVGRSWLSLLMTGGLLAAGARVVRWRSRVRLDEDRDDLDDPDDLDDEGTPAMTTRPRKIVFLGTHGQYNIGDELLLETFLWQLGSEHSYVINTYDKEFTSAQLADRYDVELIDTAGDRRAFLGHLRSCDLVCFGGGSIIKELYKSTGRHRYSTLLMILATVTFANVIARKPISMFNIGVGPITKRGGRLLARAILSQVDLLSVRDERSHATCMEIGLSPESVLLATDAVFSADEAWLLDGAPADASDTGVLRVAINLNRDIENPERWEPFLEELAAGLLELHAQHPFELHALPMQTGFKEHDDSQVLEEFATRVPAITVHRHTPRTHTQAAQLIADCDVLLSERLHAIVMASILGVPSFALAYDVKVRELAAMLEIEAHTIDINQPFTAEQVVAGLGALIEDRLAIGGQVRERSAALGDRARANFEAARSWVGGDATDVAT